MDGTPADELYRRHVSDRGTRKTSQEGASRLLADRKIAARIEALKGVVERVADEKFGLSRESWLAQFVALANQAQSTGNFSAAVRSLREIGLAMPGWYAGRKIEAEDKPVDTLTAFLGKIRARRATPPPPHILTVT